MQGLTLQVNSLEKLTRLGDLNSLQKLVLRGLLPPAALADHLPVEGVRVLSLLDNPSIDSLAFLAGRRTLSSLHVSNCSRISDLSTLTTLPLQQISLTTKNFPPTALDVISEIETLEELTLEPLPYACRDALPRAHPGVKHLTLQALHSVPLDSLPEWYGLQSLSLRGPVNIFQALRLVGELPECRELDLELMRIPDLEIMRPLPRISRLSLTNVQNFSNLEQIAETFPALRNLEVTLRVSRHSFSTDGKTIEMTPLAEKRPLDLTSLAEKIDLKVRVRIPSWGVTVIGADLFGDRLRLKELKTSGMASSRRRQDEILD